MWDRQSIQWPMQSGDSTAQIILDISNNLIPQMKICRVYKITNLSVRLWNGIRKLTTRTNSVLSEIADAALESVQLEENDIPTTDIILQVPNIESIESIDKYKICAHCPKRLTQAQGNIVNCDHCRHKMRASSCQTKVCVSLLV